MEGMYWMEFRGVIDRAKRPWRNISYYRADHGFKDTITICDFSLPKRNGALDTVEGHERDWYRDSIVCNAGWLEGYIPLADCPALWDDENKKWEVHPVRGIRNTLLQLLSHNTIERTPEVSRLLNVQQHCAVWSK